MKDKNAYIVKAIINNCTILNLRGSGYIIDREHFVTFMKTDEEEILNKREVDELSTFLNSQNKIFSSIEIEVDEKDFENGEIVNNEPLEEQFILANQNFAVNYQNTSILGIVTLK